MKHILAIGCMIGILAFVSSASGTTVLWYGLGCKDEAGVRLADGDLVQLIRSPDSAIGAPDPVTGAPTGNDSVADTAVYQYSIDAFQGDDWYETEGYYVCVRIWNADTTLVGTYYWDSPVYQAIGILPIDVACDGAQTDKPKQPSGPTPTPAGTATPTPVPVVDLSPNQTELETGDLLVMNLAISKRISGFGNLVAYVVVQTPGSAWFSFVPGEGGGFDVTRGIKPAASGEVIPAINVPILRQSITTSLARGDYWFAAAIFRAGDRISLADWRVKAIYSSEVTVTVR